MWGRSLSRLLGCIVIAVMAMGLSPISAQAHTQLLSSEPANGAVLTEAPQSVTLIFEEALLSDVDTVSINDAQGTNVTSTKVTPSGAQLALEWPADLPDGTYQVAYRVVSADGHPVTGAISFTYGMAPATSAEPSANVQVQPYPQEESSVTAWIFVSAAVLLALSIGVIYMLVRRRR